MQDEERDAEVDEPAEHGRDRDHQAREVDLGQQVGVADEADAGTREGAGEELPWQQPGEAEDRVGHIGRGALDAERPVEDDGEDDHRQKRLQDRPRNAHDGLLVAHEDVAPGEEVEQLTVGPQLACIERRPATLPLVDDEAFLNRA